MITKVPMECHDDCVIFMGGVHQPEVNCIDNSDKWRLECSTCATVLRVFDTYKEALSAGKIHASDPTRFTRFTN